jgi:hypothetical protein
MKTIKTILLMAFLALACVTPGWAGAKGGSQSNTFRLDGRTYRDFTVTFVGGEAAEVGVKGDGDTDLDLLIFDEFGNKIASDEDNTDRCYVRWVPKWTGKFTIRVVNHGHVYNEFRIATN